ncbi:MAG: phosphatase PAP2 family protein [Geminicoccaceae bacterium]
MIRRVLPGAEKAFKVTREVCVSRPRVASAVAVGLGLSLIVAIIDLPLYHWLNALDQQVIHDLGGLSVLGDSSWYLIPTALAAIAFARFARRETGFRERQAFAWISRCSTFAFVAIASSGLIAVFLKYGIGRARPKLLEEQGLLGFAPFSMDADFAGFPSGHANTIFTLALVLLFFWSRYRVLWMAIACWVAFSRVLIDAHFLSDVVGGAGLAVLTTYFWRHWFAGRRIVFDRHGPGRIRLRGARLSGWIVQRLTTWPRWRGFAEDLARTGLTLLPQRMPSLTWVSGASNRQR